MMRNLKVLGLALVAICSMSAMIASAAQAVPSFTAASYPSTITGTGGETATERFTLSAADDEAFVECATSSYDGTMAQASSTLTVSPKYENCKAFGFLNATVNPEGCQYVFHATERVVEDQYKAHVDVTCPAGQSIKITANGGSCASEVKAQTGLTTAKITNDTATGVVTVTPEVSGIAYTVTADGFLCPMTGTGSKTGAKYTSTNPIKVEGSTGAIQVSGS